MKDRFNELIKDLGIKNERGKIITLHLYIEEWLDEIIKTFGGITKIKRRLTFWQKAKLIHSIDLMDDLLVNNILLINRLRNMYGHNRKVDENKKLDLIAQLKLRPNYDWEGFNKLDAICSLTMMDLQEILDYVKKENSN